MNEFLQAYQTVVAAYAALGALVLVQVFVADAALMRAGHVPGTPVGGGHNDFLFRATRAHANTNENLALFLVASLAAILSAATPRWCGILAWGFVAARLVHMLAYYGDVRLLRSAAFSVGLLCTAGLITLAAVALA
jgi:uncharacterized MAPEG superfamily protein